MKQAPRAGIASGRGVVYAPVQAEGDVVKQAQSENTHPVGFGASNPAHTSGGQTRTAGCRTSDWLRRPGDVVHRLVCLQFDQETIDRPIVNETPYRPQAGGRRSGIAP